MTGDQSDIYARLRGKMPPWFGDEPPLIDAILQGAASGLAFIYSLYAYAKLQTRIKTATGGWLDLIASDFLGSTLTRRANETDASFLNRIIVNLFRERGTRASVISVLNDLTGRAPLIVEPKRPLDTGGYGTGYIGYGVAGAYGSILLPYQAFVTAYRPIGTGIPYVAGYGSSPAGYSRGSRAEYASLSMVITTVSDADIYAAVASVIPAGTIAWMRISD